jgi:hypothetical protein
MTVVVLNRQQPGAPALGGDPGPLSCHVPVRGAGQIPKHTPPDGWVTLEQPRQEHIVDVGVHPAILYRDAS